MITSAIPLSSWRSLLYRGALGLLFGGLVLLGAERSLGWFAPLMLFYAMADGVLAIAAAARAAYGCERWGCLLIDGLAGVGGVLAFAVWQDIKLEALAWSVAGWATLTGICALYTAVCLRERVTRPWLFAALAVVTIRLATLAIGAARSGESAIAACVSVAAFAFVLLLLIWVARLPRSLARLLTRVV
jgi:uncharacterized membrane protein HdeD (DUF308 family)